MKCNLSITGCDLIKKYSRSVNVRDEKMVKYKRVKSDYFFSWSKKNCHLNKKSKTLTIFFSYRINVLNQSKYVEN